MTPDEAAWVRQHVWTKPMASALAPIDVCPCAYGPSTWCLHGSCAECTQPEAVAFPETHVTDKAGRVLHAAGFRESHPMVWLADRVCRWRCSCDCHATASAAPMGSSPCYVQPALWADMDVAS
jgi:hypothetical protein